MFRFTEARVLLVEIVNADQTPGQLSHIYPLLSGHLRYFGRTVRWLRFGVSTDNLLTHGRDEVTLPDDDLARLCAVVAELEPELLVSTHEIFEGQLAAIRGVVPLRFVFLDGERYLRWASERADRWEDSYFRFLGEMDRPGFRPNYHWEAGNASALNRQCHNVYIEQVSHCGYRASVSRNPFYADLILPEGCRSNGCAFCGTPPSPLLHRAADEEDGAEVNPLRGKTPDEWTVRQIEAVVATFGDPPPEALLFEDAPSSATLDRIAQILATSGLRDKVKLLFGLRADRILHLQDALQRNVAALVGTQGRIGLYACGLENFAADVLLRLNKGTTPLMNLKAIQCLRDLRGRHPENFEYNGLSVILFTPWTTFEDLHLNVGLLRRLRLGAEVGNIFQARLRLHPSLAITALAARDGLLEAQETDDLLRMNRRKLFTAERPWRFREPRLAPLSRVVLRFGVQPSAHGSALDREVYEMACEVERSGCRQHDMLDLFEACIDVARSSAAVLQETDLLRRAVALVRTRRAQEASAQSARPLRIGEQLTGAAEHLDRLAGLVAAGIKPLLSLENLREADLRAMDLAALAQRGLHHTAVRDDQARFTLHVARDPSLLERRLEVAATLRSAADAAQKSAAHAEAGRLHGYPACCVAAFAAEPDPAWPSAVSALALRVSDPSPIEPALQPLLVPDVAFRPCSLHCAAAAQHGRTVLEHLGMPAADTARAFLFPLDAAAPAELVSLHVLEREGDELHYDPESILEGPGALRAALRSGDRLRFLAGQIQVWGKDGLLELWTLSVGFWWPGGVFLAEEWQVLCQELARPVPACAAELASDSQVASSRALLPAARTSGQAAQPDSLATRSGTLQVTFRDRQGRCADLTFSIGALREGDRVFQRHGAIGLAYGSGADPALVRLCATPLLGAMRVVGEPPGAENHARWQEALAASMRACSVLRRFRCSVARLA